MVTVVAATACSSSRSSAPTSTSSPPVTGRPTTTVTTTPVQVPPSSVPVPTVTGPVSGGTPDVAVNAMPLELGTQYGYQEKEYFFSGTARSFSTRHPLGTNGEWRVVPTNKT